MGSVLQSFMDWSHRPLAPEAIELGFQQTFSTLSHSVLCTRKHMASRVVFGMSFSVNRARVFDCSSALLLRYIKQPRQAIAHAARS